MVDQPGATTESATASNVANDGRVRPDWWNRRSETARRAVVGAVAILATAGTVALPHMDGGAPPSTGLNLEFINGCGPDGSATQDKKKLSNRLKNRFDFPSDETFNHDATFEKLAGSDKRGELTEDQSAEIFGYVVEVKKGGKESCNCGTNDPTYLDTHIFIGPKKDSPKRDCLVVEITPRMRTIMATQGVDWSYATLKKNFEDKYVRVSGWLFFDEEHIGNSVVNSPSNKNLWRKSCWEIHPVTELEMETEPTPAPP